jgi:hypothetical protein
MVFALSRPMFDDARIAALHKVGFEGTVRDREQ